MEPLFCFAVDGSADWNIMLTSLPILSVRTSCFVRPCALDVCEGCARCCHVVLSVHQSRVNPTKPRLLYCSTLRSHCLSTFTSSVRALFPYNNVASFVCVSMWGKKCFVRCALTSSCIVELLEPFIRVHCSKVVFFIADGQVCVE